MLFANSAAAADDPEVTRDVQCLAVNAYLASKDDASLKMAGLMASLYYLGRLDGRDPDADLNRRLTDEVMKLKPDDIAVLAKSCGETLADRGKALKAAGQHLQERALDIGKPKT